MLFELERVSGNGTLQKEKGPQSLRIAGSKLLELSIRSLRSYLLKSISRSERLTSRSSMGFDPSAIRPQSSAERPCSQPPSDSISLWHLTQRVLKGSAFKRATGIVQPQASHLP